MATAQRPWIPTQKGWRQPPDPAHARGLRRARVLSPCPAPQRTPLPLAPSDVEVLALLTRHRASLIGRGELSERFLFDVRAYKTARAELAYLHRLAAGGRYGGTVATSLPQLVAGLSHLHPAWKLSGDRFADRDCHGGAVKRRLRALKGCGLLRWRIGVDEAGEERRTELDLLAVPELAPEELEGARTQLERWARRYGAQLDTGSRTGIRDVGKASAALSSSERQRRGCAHAKARADGSRSSSPPPSGALSTTEQNNLESSANAHITTNPLRLRTGAHTRENLPRPDPAPSPSPNDLLSLPAKAALNRGEPLGEVGSSEWQRALLERVAAREAERAEIMGIIARQAQARAFELADAPARRWWPESRVREAWVVARFGAQHAAEVGPGAAGTLRPEDRARLERALARYERYLTGAPDGYPATGLAGLLHLGATTGPTGPRTLRYAIGALDQLTRRMRAHASAHNPERLQRAKHRAERRHSPSNPHHGWTFRLRESNWPSWVKLSPSGKPILCGGELVVNPDSAPAAGDAFRRVVERDAKLLADEIPPPSLDGRLAMSERDHGKLSPAERRHPVDHELAELAHLTGQPIRHLTLLSPTLTQQLLQRARTERAHRDRALAQDFRERISRIACDTDTARPLP